MTSRIATIHFAPVHADRSPVGLGHFELPAVADNAEPFIFTLENRIQRDQGTYGDGNGQYRPVKTYEVRSLEIASDLVGEWTERGHMMSPGCHPGIWVVRDHLPLLDENGRSAKDAAGHALWREATPEERKAMWAEDLAAAKLADRAYAVVLFNYWAGRCEGHPDMRKNVSKVCRLGAERYGFTGDWLSEANATQSELCPYCRKAVPMGAVKCPNCKEVVDFEAYAELEAKKAKALEAATQHKPITPPVSRQAQPARA